MSRRVGLVGARGYAGGEFIRLLAARSDLALALVASRQHAGAPARALSPFAPEGLTVVEPEPIAIAEAGLDAVVLALPNGLAAPFVATIDAVAPQTVIVDLSLDYRGHEAWTYGLPEINRDIVRGARRIANPGCYATAAALAIAPLRGRLADVPIAFGVSGWSGAGTTPGPRNDSARLADSLMPYALSGHGHEAELNTLFGEPVRLIPHVAGFFRGLSASVEMRLVDPMSATALRSIYERFYADEPLVRVQVEPPELRDGRDIPGAVVGGFGAPDGARACVVCVLDNLLKGAAAQALQNLALALDLAEFEGLL